MNHTVTMMKYVFEFAIVLCMPAVCEGSGLAVKHKSWFPINVLLSSFRNRCTKMRDETDERQMTSRLLPLILTLATILSN